jgi:hypothetical protein
VVRLELHRSISSWPAHDIGEVCLDSLMKQAVWKDPTLLAELIDNIRSLVFDACEIEVKEIFWITCGCNARR